MGPHTLLWLQEQGLICGIKVLLHNPPINKTHRAMHQHQVGYQGQGLPPALPSSRSGPLTDTRPHITCTEGHPGDGQS